MIILTFFKFFL